jgi:hypothetical protein
MGNIKLGVVPKSMPNLEKMTSPNRFHQNQKANVGNPLLPPPLPSTLDHKQKQGVKKNLNMTIIVHEELVANVAFSNDEEEDGTSSSNKGPYEKTP